MSDLYMVFDVESVGLHGIGFAVGWVIVHRERGMLGDRIAVADTSGWSIPERVQMNVMPRLPAPTHGHVEDMRHEFWRAWEYWRGQGALLAADVPWPVEARFLAACVDEDRKGREWGGPYPLIDIASVRLAAGQDPLGEVERLANELPEHNPRADARQSARLLLEALNACKTPGPRREGDVDVCRSCGTVLGS